jgi:hypothetical protein
VSEALEITTFRLTPGVSMSDFIEANSDVDHWLKQQPGFIWRRICGGEDGRIVDALLWASADDGRRAAAGVVTELAGSPVHAAIDQATADWSVVTCHHSVGILGV